jgi:hypothetical protein
MRPTRCAGSTVVEFVLRSHEEHQQDSRTAYLNKYLKM